MLRPVAVAAVLLVATSVAAEEGYRYGRIRYCEPHVLLQRAAESEAEEAEANAPFVPGDRVWSDERGRAEIQLFDGSLLWLDTTTQIDYSAHEGDGEDDQVVLRVGSGSLGLRAWGRRALRLVLETPHGGVEVSGAAYLRLDVGPSITRLVVREGEAALVAEGQQVLVVEDERAEVRGGEAPEGSWKDDAGESDELDEWIAEREHGDTWRTAGRRYLPTDLDPYSAELDTYGTWYYETDVGNVWRPHVAAEWSPYWNGRWAWTAFGWTWVANEPWGWAPFHYGRWGHSVALGWYWVPNTTWGPAWVSWAVDGRHVGWCALDRWDRPVVRRAHRYGRGGHARARTARAEGGSAWLFVQRGDFGGRDVARRRRADATPQSPGVRLFDGARFAPSRRLTETIASDRRALAQLRHHTSTGDRLADRWRGRPTGTEGRAAHTLPRSLRSEERLRDRTGERRERLAPSGTERRRGGRLRDELGDDSLVGRPWTGRPWPGDDSVSQRPRRRERDEAAGPRLERPRRDATEADDGGRRGRVRDEMGSREREGTSDRERVLDRVFRPLSDEGHERHRDGGAVRDHTRERERPRERPRAQAPEPSRARDQPRERPASGASDRSRERHGGGAARRHR